MAETDTKKVLIITYYWPPAGGPGVQRWLKFVKYLPKFKIDPIVFIPDNAHYPIIDPSLVNEVDSSLEVIRLPISEPYRLASLFSSNKSKTLSKGVISNKGKQSVIERLMLYVRGNFFIPDARKSWVKPSAKFLIKYLREHNIDTVITTGPPHSLHLIGLSLKSKVGIKWIADFRDPWTTIGYHKKLKLSTRAQKKHNEWERKVLNGADIIMVTSEPTKNEFLSKTQQPIFVITNGFDTHDLEQPPKDAAFSIAHIGSLLSERNPKALWKALSELIKEEEIFSKHFKLNLAGTVSQEILDTITLFGLQPYTEFLGYIEHKDALRMQMSSRLLLLIEIDSEETKAIIPGKLFEYLNSGTPIIGIGPRDSQVEHIIGSTSSGEYLYFKDSEGIKKVILLYFQKFMNGNLENESREIEKYSRENLTKQLAELI